MPILVLPAVFVGLIEGRGLMPGSTRGRMWVQVRRCMSYRVDARQVLGDVLMTIRLRWGSSILNRGRYSGLGILAPTARHVGAPTF